MKRWTRILLMLMLACLLGSASVRAQSGDKPAEEPKKEEPKSGEQEGDKAVEVKLDKDGKPAPAEEPAEGEAAAKPDAGGDAATRDAAQGGKPPANAADDGGAVSGQSSVQSTGGEKLVKPVDEATPPLPRPEDQSSGLLSSPTNQQGPQPPSSGANVAEGGSPDPNEVRQLPGVTTLNERLGQGNQGPYLPEEPAGMSGDRSAAQTPGFIADDEEALPSDTKELDDLFDLSDLGIDSDQLTLDMTPEEFLEQYEQKLEFRSLLPESNLPEGEVPDIISRQEAQPGIGLMDNYAWVSVPTGNVRGSTETKQFHMDGGVIIYFDEITISGDTADIDEKNEVAVLSGNVNIIDPKYTLKTDELRILFNDKKFQATGFVSFKKLTDKQKSEPDMSLGPKDRLREYFAAREFELSCEKLFYDWDSREMIAIGDVRMTHPVFKGSMYRIDYNDTSKEYLMSGGIQLSVEKYDWIFENELAAPEDEKKLRALTDGKTDIKSDRLAYEESTGIAKFYSTPGGQVSFQQPKRGIKAAYIEINDTSKDFYAEGTTSQKVSYSQTDGEWLIAGGLIDSENASQELQDTVKEALDAESQTLEYNFERKRIEMHGDVKITSGEKLLQAGEMIQDETAKFFLLRDNVLVKPDPDSSVYCAQVYVDTANDVFTFVGLVQGSFVSEDLKAATPEVSTEFTEQAANSGAFGTESGTGNNTGNGTNVVEGNR